jgi:cytochrome c553
MKKDGMISKLAVGLGATLFTLTSLMGADGATLYKKCASCHGLKAEKPALGKSQVIQGWEATKVVNALQGYKEGTYGGAMKGLMKGQVASLNPESMKILGEYIHSLK